jgi:hypothetical protein
MSTPMMLNLSFSGAQSIMENTINRQFRNKVRSIVRELEEAASVGDSVKVDELCDDLEKRISELESESARLTRIVTKYRRPEPEVLRKFRIDPIEFERAISFED